MAYHGRTPKSVLEAPNSTLVVVSHRTAGYIQMTDGSLRRTTPRRGKKVKRWATAAAKG